MASTKNDSGPAAIASPSEDTKFWLAMIIPPVVAGLAMLIL